MKNMKSTFYPLVMMIVLLFSHQVVGSNTPNLENKQLIQPIMNRHYVVSVKNHDVMSYFLFDTLAKKFNLTIEYRKYDNFHQILNSVSDGSSDFAANATYTKERAQFVHYSSPTNVLYTYFYSLNDLELPTSNLSRIGIPINTVYGSLVEYYHPNAELIEFWGLEHASQLLEENKVDTVIDTIDQLEPMLSKGFDAHLLNDRYTIKPVSIIASKAIDPEVLAVYADYLLSDEIQQNLRSELDRYQFSIRQKALRDIVVQRGIDKKQVLTIKLDNLTPYAFYQDNNVPKGISADILFQACQILDLTCKVISTQDETWEHMYQDFVEQKIDIISPFSISNFRKSSFYMSKPYYHSPVFIIKRKGYKDEQYHTISDLLSERIGIVKYDYLDEILPSFLPQKSIFYFNTTTELINALLDNKIDYFALDEASFDAIIEKNEDLNIEKDSNISSFYSMDVTFGFNKTEKGAILADLFTKAIKIINTHNIALQYEIIPDLPNQSIFYNKSIVYSFIIIIIIASIIIMFIFYKQSNTDVLTSLKNRRSFDHKYNKYNKYINADLTLIYIDINKFKQINDQQGHDIGDLILKQLALRIKKSWKGEKYRIGGDEFILIGKIDIEQLYAFIQYVERFNILNPNTEQVLEISISMGISLPRKQKMLINNVIAMTDQAMYIAKRSEKSYHFTNDINKL